MRDIFKLRNTEQLTNLSNFNTKEELNDYLARVKYTYKEDLGEDLYEFVYYLSHYAVKVVGVTWQKPETMAKNFGKSERTIRRYLKKLTDFGIIGREKAENGNHNITYFRKDVDVKELPSDKVVISSDIAEMSYQENDENPCDSNDEVEKSSKETLTTKALNKNSKEYKERYKGGVSFENDIATNRLDNTYVPQWVAEDFIETVKPFYKDAKTITKLWTKATYAARKEGLCDKNEGPLHLSYIVVDAFKTAVYDKKQRKIKGSFFGYFYGIVRKMFDDYSTELAALDRKQPDDSIYFDWLNDDETAVI